MPRKNLAVVRTTLVALTLVVVLGLVGQAAQAVPLTPRPTLAGPASVDTLTGLWSWFTSRLAATFNLASQAPTQHPKTSVVADPVGNASVVVIQPAVPIAP
jgi:hypothetical protein